MKIKKINKRDVGRFFIDIAFFLVGCVSYATAVTVFNSPNNIAQGGASGLAIIINYLVPAISMGTVVIVVNIPLFIISYFKYGKDFILKTVIATVMLSVIIDVMDILVEKYSLQYTGDRLMAAIFGGVLCGLGLGLVFSRGATTGGTDILGRLLKSKLPQVPMGRLVMIMDLFIVAIAGIVYRSIESMLYACIVFFLSSETLDYVLYGSKKNKLMLIFTSKPDEVSEILRSSSPHGVAKIRLEDSYDKKDRMLLITAVRPSEVVKVRKLILEADEQPFIVVTDSSEIRGKGFRSLDLKDDL